MKLTKYEHACFTLETGGQVLVVDPGNFTSDFRPGNNIAVVIITHEHTDHFDKNTLQKIHELNPNTVFVSLPYIIQQLPPDWQTRAVKPGDSIELELFTLEFFGGKHALIHDTIPPIDNIGVLINNAVYYPGDSFALTNKPVDVLALPVGAPWMKTGEAMDFLKAIKPLLTFPTHDATLSDIGKSLADRQITTTAESLGAEYKRLDNKTVEV